MKRGEKVATGTCLYTAILAATQSSKGSKGREGSPVVFVACPAKMSLRY